jgi:putative inorganic carbon (HCO3(-)) transporter
MHLHLGIEGSIPVALYFSGIVAFLLSVFGRPAIGLYLLVFTLPMQTGRYKLHGLPLGDQFLDVLLLGVVLGLLFSGQAVVERTPLTAFLIGLAAFYYLSLWQGAFYLDGPLPVSLGDPRFSNWKNYAEMFYVCLVVATVVKNPRQARVLLLLMCVSVLLVNRSFYLTMSERDLSHFSYDNRYAGALGYAGVNGLAAFEAMFAAFLLGVCAYEKRLLVKIGLWAVVLTNLYCLLYSFSRGGYLGFLAALVVLGFLKDRKMLILVVALFLVWQTILPVAVQQRITMTTEDAAPGGQFESSAQERIDLWNDAMVAIKQNPVVGRGFDTYEFLGRLGRFRDTHNYYLKMLFETGLVGLGLLIWLLARMWRLGYSLFRDAENAFWASLGLGFLGLMASATVCNFFGDRWTYQQVDGYLWVVLGCVLRGLIVVRQKLDEAEVEKPAVVSETAAPMPTTA